jgi:hypothetical protein
LTLPAPWEVLSSTQPNSIWIACSSRPSAVRDEETMNWVFGRTV